MKKILLFLLLAGFIKINAQSITIAAAADLRFALDDITRLYKEKHRYFISKIDKENLKIGTEEVTKFIISDNDFSDI